MRLELTGKGIDITAGLRQLVDKRLERVQRLLGRSMVSAQCVLSTVKYLNRADLTVFVAGDHVFHGVGEGRNWPAAMTAAVAKVMQQAHTQKDKWKDKRKADAKKTTTRRGAAAGERESMPVDAAAAAAVRVRKIRYPVKPMTVDEAAGLLQDNGEAFIVFRNARTESVSVVFRRKDGNVGLIETEK